jgi:cyclopropane-fatty-acyl-phospholipid synthase
MWMILTETTGQKDLPRYFAAVFDTTKKINNGRLDYVMPDGRRFRAEGPNPGPVGEVIVHNTDCFARLIREGDLGFCDAYLEGWWSTPDLQALMDFVHEDNEEIYDGFPGMGLLRLYERTRHWLKRNSKEQAKKNISYHYDLGNDFYKLWLDESMTYSSALFQTGQESLEAAQEAKYASMVDQMGAKPGDHVLEIGCGWGGFAEYAARERGLRVTGLTISREQFVYAQERIAKAGLSDMVEFKLQDYRDERGSYDGIASIEMFEAVGERYWPTYFNTVRDRLRPGGRATLQVITVEDRRFEAYRNTRRFHPEIHLPRRHAAQPLGAASAEVERAGLQVLRSIEFGESYSQTLRRWHDTFNEKWDEVARIWASTTASAGCGISTSPLAPARSAAETAT